MKTEVSKLVLLIFKVYGYPSGHFAFRYFQRLFIEKKLNEEQFQSLLPYCYGKNITKTVGEIYCEALKQEE